MEIAINVLSTEIIKPSSPTPKSLQKYQLSLLDQFLPPVFIPAVYFFSSNLKIPNSQKSNHLKKSLSETLSTYYPFAGRFTAGNLFVVCNDGGVPFSIAEANCNLSQIDLDPNHIIMTKLLLPHNIIESQDFCLAVQATYFRCGGLALGLLFSHRIADALSFLYFVNSWSSVARIGDFGTVPVPMFDTATYFPPQDIPEFDVNAEMMKQDLTTKTIKFPAAKISLLREMYSGGGNWRPNRVEALSAYLWTQFLSATSTQHDSNKIYQFIHPVNLRNRIHKLPPSQYRFGNVIGASMTKSAVGDGGFEICKKIRQGYEGVYDSYMALTKNATEKGTNLLDEIATVAHLCFSSVCGFPIYEVDFGWGKPIWFGQPGLPLHNFVVFMDAKTGGDIDAIIRLNKNDMEKFEAHLKSQTMLKSNL